MNLVVMGAITVNRLIFTQNEHIVSIEIQPSTVTSKPQVD